jgi:hypothetical protein
MTEQPQDIAQGRIDITAALSQFIQSEIQARHGYGPVATLKHR